MKIFLHALAAMLIVMITSQTLFAQKGVTVTTTKTVKDSLMYDKADSVTPPVVTHHQITIDGKSITYTATTGYMPMKDSMGKLMAKIFYVAYTKDGVSKDEKRPVTFTFNGGPGSASIWLHMGSYSPVRVNFADDKGDAPAPPYTYSDNPNSWLGFTDLVFIDPVSTGYSQANKGVNPKKYHGYNQDVASVGNFIRMYITRNERWNSPKFIAGESYGTTRAAGLSGYLQDSYGMYMNGIVLISSCLNYQLLDFDHGNEIPYVLFLPTYATTAQYHKKLSPELESLPVDQLAKRVETFAQGTYSYFLFQGDKASEDLTNKVIDSINLFTGIPKDYIRQSKERIQDYRFFKEVLRGDSKIVGRFDSRFTGEDEDDAGEGPSYDPSDANINGSFNSVFNEYVRKDLGYKSDQPYNSFGNVWPWDFQPFENAYLDVSGTLRNAMTQNSHLKVMVVCGYYDLATPFFNAEYAVDHLGLRPDVRNNISLSYYTAGHMVYVNKDDDVKLKNDAQNFYMNAVK